MKFYLTAIIATFISLSIISCNDDDDDKRVTISPSGIIIEGEIFPTDNKQDIHIPFRVNPSNYEIKPGEISLDCIYASTIGRGIAVTPPENLELVEVKASLDEAGKAVEGEWEATVKVKEGLPFAETTHLYMVLTFEDANGESVSITSNNYAEVVTFPALSEEMVTFSNPIAQSYKSPVTGEALTSRIRVTPNKLNETTEIPYMLPLLLQNITFSLEGEFADYFQSSLVRDNSLPVNEITPVTADLDAYFAQHPEVDAIPVTSKLTLTDIFGNTLTHQTEVSFYRPVIVLPATEELTYKKTDLGNGVVDEFKIEIGEYLPKIGITRELLQNLPGQAFAVACTGYMPDGEEGNHGFGFTTESDGYWYIQTGKFEATLDVLFTDSQPSGTYQAVLRFVITNPITRDVLIRADVRQEIKIVD